MYVDVIYSCYRKFVNFLIFLKFFQIFVWYLCMNKFFNVYVYKVEI